MSATAKQMPEYLVDAIRSIGVHNGVARVEFLRLSADGTPASAVELLIPIPQIKDILDGLSKVAR
jgi:hypothetical protein